MPVSNPKIVDALSVDPASGVIELQMFEDREWIDVTQMLQDLQIKVNAYIDFVLSGQLYAKPEYNARPVRIIVHFQFDPPSQVQEVCQKLAVHLHGLSMELAIILGRGLSNYTKM